MAYNSVGAVAGASDLKQRLSRALLDVSGTLASVKSGALVQVWMPEHIHDGTIVLSCQGLPFAVAGVGDLLALFRCVSVRYRFSTDVMKPTLMGAVGRVYSTLEPEMSHNVQKYDKQVYLRVSEAQRCRVHSTLMVPIFGSDSRDTPLAVFELVQGDRDVTFQAVLSQLTSSLQSVSLYTTDLEAAACAAGLRKWPMHIDTAPASEHSGGAAGRLSPTSDEPMRINSVPRIQELAEDKEQAASSLVVATEERGSPPGLRGDEAGSWSGERSLGSHAFTARASAGSIPVQQQGGSGPIMQMQQDMQLRGVLQHGVPSMQAMSHLSNPAAVPSAAKLPESADALLGAALKREVGGQSQEAAGTTASEGLNGRQASSGLPLDSGNAQQLMSWLATQGSGGNNALEQLRALLSNQPLPPQRPSEQGGNGDGPSGQQGGGASAPQSAKAQPMDAQVPAARSGSSPPPNLASSPVKIAQAPGTCDTSGVAAMVPAAPAADKQKLARSASLQRTLLCAAADGDDGDEEDISSGGEEEDSDDERGGSHRNNNRVGGGAGKRLRFEDLQAQFGLGLKEAANNLGICATTLKRACRRHGIKRWPRRQIAKLSKALNQMGYNGAPPPALVQNAVVSAQPAPKPKAAKKPDASALQQATQLLFQQQLAAGNAAAAMSGGGVFPNIGPAGMMMGGHLLSMQPSSMPQGVHSMFAVPGHAVQQQQQPHQLQQSTLQQAPPQQQPQGIYHGGSYMGPIGPAMGQHTVGPNPGGQGGPLGQSAQVLAGGIPNGLGAAMQIQGMGALGAIQSSALGPMQATALGMQMPSTTGMQQMPGSNAPAIQMPVNTGMLHPLLAGASFSMHQMLQHHQQQHLQQQQQHLQLQQQQHQLHQQQQQQQQHQHHHVLQQHLQAQAAAQQQQQQQSTGLSGHPMAPADGWLSPAPGSAASVFMASSAGPVAQPAAAAMDVAPPRISCGYAHSPFSGLGMSPGTSGGGLSEIPEDFIQNLNSTAGAPGQLSQMIKSGVGMELMDLLGDDLTAR